MHLLVYGVADIERDGLGDGPSRRGEVTPVAKFDQGNFGQPILQPAASCLPILSSSKLAEGGENEFRGITRRLYPSLGYSEV
jgi:hypothetical protein